MRTTEHKYRNGSVFESGLEYETTVYDGTTSTGTVDAAHPHDVGALDLDTTRGGPAATPPLDLGGHHRRAACSALRGHADRSRRSSRTGTPAESLQQTTTMTYAYDRLGNPTTDRRPRPARHDGRRHRSPPSPYAQLRDEHQRAT